jgi:hypothetical protein
LVRAEKLATLVGIGTSLATVAILFAELPKDESSANISLGLVAVIVIIALLLAYVMYFNRNIQSSRAYVRQRSRTTEERRLREEFPTIFAFVESIGEIRSERDFDQFVTQLNHLLELERRARGIKWSDVKDIETMKAIAYAQLMEKRSKKEKE